MALAIGIDTGGTYTDGVVFDLEIKKTLSKTKSLTTYEDLAIGIRNSIENLHLGDFGDIKLVALSTTLATNAIVEGRGTEVGLILIGEDPVGTLPVKHYAVVEGGHDIKGEPKEELNLTKVQEFLEGIKGKVEAVAISGFASVRNPQHELKVKELVKEFMDVPVVCGHELTTVLGFHERTVTAALNAKLIPIIANLIDSVKKVLDQKAITAQLMIVKGDGTLMNEVTALEKPIETILSGPAASIIGATNLTNVEKALILDMGGTTSDIAIVENGSPKLNLEGASVGGWLTRVQAADISTFGIGGDSCISLKKDGTFEIGPQKVWPLAVLGSRFPYLYEELILQQQNFSRIKLSNITDCYFLARENSQETLSFVEKKVIEVLKSGAHSLLFIANALDKSPFSLDLQPLVRKGVIARAAVTPTDILHVTGEYVNWDEKIAKLAVGILAELAKIPMLEFTKLAKASIADKLYLIVLQTLMQKEGAPKEIIQNLEKNFFVHKTLTASESDLFSTAINVKIPIIGIGAPVRAFLPEVAQKLQTKLMVPPDWDVANAVGAAAGSVMEKVKILIKAASDGFILFSQWERKLFSDENEAKNYGLAEARKRSIAAAEKAGVSDYQIMEMCEDKYTNGQSGTYLETNIEVAVLGRPKW